MKYTFCWVSAFSFLLWLYNWINGPQSKFLLHYEILSSRMQSLIFELSCSIVVSPGAMSRWRKIIRILTLQQFQFQHVTDSVMKMSDDDDVMMEQEQVHSGNAIADRIVVRNLSKVYDDGKVAVDNLSIGIAPGECFGLLGINGESPQHNIFTSVFFFLMVEYVPS
jgi:hypothetical protein